MLASREAWTEFEAGWIPMLRRFSVPELHMADLNHFTGEFSGWTEPRRREFLDAFFALLERNGPFVPIGRPHIVAFYREARLLPPGDVGAPTSPEHHLSHLLGEDPIVTCFRDVVSVADDEMALRWSPDERIEVFFDERPNREEPIRRAYSILTRSRSSLIGEITFASSCELVPLQAADFVAYEIAKNAAEPSRRRASDRRLLSLRG